MELGTTLHRIEDAGLIAEAEQLRQVVTAMRLEATRRSLRRTQEIVAANVGERGYDKRGDGTPWTADEMAARQVLKSLIEAVEALRHVRFVPCGDIAILLDAADSLEAMANFVFGNERMCVGATIDDAPAFLVECADVMIPMFTAFDALDADAEFGVMSKSGSDVERGVTGRAIPDLLRR